MKEKNKTEVKEGQKPGKPGGYSFAILGAKRERKRVAAETRQSAYDALTTDQKIIRAKKHRGESKQELARLLKIKETKPKVAVVIPPTPEVVKSTEAPKKKAYQKPRKS